MYFRRFFLTTCIFIAALCLPSALTADEEEEFEIVKVKSKSRSSAAVVAASGFNNDDIAPEYENLCGGGEDDFVIITGDEEKKIYNAAAKRAAANAPLSDENFFILKPEKQKDPQKAYEAALKKYEKWEADVKKKRKFLFYYYTPYTNEINELDARLFITLFLLSVTYSLIMLIIYIKEAGRRPPVYSAEEMKEWREEGFDIVSESEAKVYAATLWNNVAGGKQIADDDFLELESRSEISILENEMHMVARTLPTDDESIYYLNKISDSINSCKTRFMIAPWLSVSSGIFKRIVLAILYVILLFLYPGHPMYLLVILLPVAFLTPYYLIDAREGSFVYRMLGGSLKVFGAITGDAFRGAANMEGASVTVYKGGGATYIEHNYWGVLILFALKIALAVMLLILIYFMAPFIVLYAIIRNYILAK